MRKLRILVLYYESGVNATLSYQSSWAQNLINSNLFTSKQINLARHDVELLYKRYTRWRIFDAIVLLHSVFSNTNYLKGKMEDILAEANPPIIYFIGNEYKLMHKKMEFCDRIGVNMLITQSNSEDVATLYRNRLGCMVNYLPNTGLDTGIFYETRPFEERVLDFGYRSFPSPWYLGHNERIEIADFFILNKDRYQLKVDISLDPSKRLQRKDWAFFLNTCKAQIGTEAGGDFFELDDHTRFAVNEYICLNQDATFDEIYSEFFVDYEDNTPLRIMSSRNIETAGSKTLQVLFEGEYNDHFKAGEHYLALKKDFSNFGDVMEQFSDVTHCKRIIENAYSLVLEKYTFERLLAELHQIVKKVI